MGATVTDGQIYIDTVLSPYLGTSRTMLTRAFRNGKTIGKTPKNEVPRDKSLNNIFYMHKSAFKDSSKFGLNGPP